jgi:hypothetical protein
MLPNSAVQPTSIHRDTGGVLLFADALKQYPDARLVVYNRVSTYSQAGKGKVRLEEKTSAIYRVIWELAPNFPLRASVRGIEEGKLSKPRPALHRAMKAARDYRGPAILVTSDLSRLIRSEDYHRQTNPDAWPTLEEFALLREMT